MGDIADMMLDGTLCGQCGAYIDGNGEGFQRFCSGCKRDNKATKKQQNDNQAIGEKQLKVLKSALRDTDYPSGMYLGLHIDAAPAQIRKLAARGFVEIYQPHNPVHKERAIITDAGRLALKNNGLK